MATPFGILGEEKHPTDSARNQGRHEIVLLQRLLRIEPESVEVRARLRAIERKRKAEAFCLPFFWSVIARTRSCFKIGLCTLLGWHRQRIMACEGYLEFQPNSKWVLRAMMVSAMKLGYKDMASYVLQDLRSLESALPPSS